MAYDDHSYHRERALHCRKMAERARDPDIRRRHEQLAMLHAAQASRAGLMRTAVEALS